MSQFEGPHGTQGTQGTQGHQDIPEGQWSPPQQYSEPHSTYPEAYAHHDQKMSVDSTPQTVDGRWGSPPPKSGFSDYASPDMNSRDHEAPEVIHAYMWDQSHDRPLSPSSHGGTTVYSPRITPFDLNGKVEPIAEESQVPSPEEEPRRFGMRKRMFNIVVIAVVIFIIVLAVALGVGLGVGLKKNDSDSDSSSRGDPYCRDHPEVCVGGMIDPDYYSTKGAFNGSGIALAGESWSQDKRRIFTLYFQHHTGDIRFMQYTTEKKWIGGTRSETVATDAKNGTALSTVAYAVDSTQFFHVFYVSKDNLVRQVTNTNTSNIWQEGPLNKLNLSVYDSPGTVGLQACWKGNFYGDSDYSKMPTPTGEKNEVPFEERQAMNIWFATDDSTFQQYAWYRGLDDWGELDKWQGKSTRAGVGCYSWGEGTTTYTMMVNKNNDTEIWWKDTANMTSTESHPVMSWQNSTKGLIKDVYPTTSLGYTTYFYAQMADKSIMGYNITYEAENTTTVPEDTFTINNPAGPAYGLGGTHLTATAYAEMDGDRIVWDSLYVFYQTDGDDITAFTRPIQGGEWSNGKLKIPDE